MRSRTPSERAIIFAGVLGGLSLEQINKLLEPLVPTAASVPDSSYLMMRKDYFDKMVEGIGSRASDETNPFGEMIFHPKPIGDL
jgi:hypothetical protein